MGLAIAKSQKPRAPVPTGQLAEEDEDEVDITIPIKVENVHIDGLKKTEQSLVTKQLESLLDAKSFEELLDSAGHAKLRLQRLGIFKAIEIFVDVSRKEDASPEGLDVYFLLEESRFVTANAGTNVGNNEGNMVFGGKLNNIRGMAESVRSDISIGTRSSSTYELSFSKPLFKNPDCKLLAKLYKSSTEVPQSFYKQCSRGIGMEFTVPSPIGLHNFKYDGQWRENSGVSPKAPFIVREQCGHVLKSSVQHSLVSDGRDDLLLPKNGHFFKHGLEFSGIGGNVKYVKSEVEFQLNKELINDVVLGMSFQAGAMKPIGESDTLINDRFFLGGPLSVRGFKMKGIGPRVREASLGADAFWAAGLHMYTPLPFRPGKGGFGDLFRLHFFANAGNAQDMDLTAYNHMEMNKMIKEARWSYGLGLMMMIGGIARLEVNYCIPRNAKTSDGLNPGLQVGVGMNFL